MTNGHPLKGVKNLRFGEINSAYSKSTQAKIDWCRVNYELTHSLESKAWSRESGKENPDSYRDDSGHTTKDY